MSVKSKSYYSKEYDLHNCDEEPIRRIRRCQRYGSLVCCSIDGEKFYHFSEDLADEISTMSPSELLRKIAGIDITLYGEIAEPVYVSHIGFDLAAIIQKSNDRLIVELEPNDGTSDIVVTDEDYQDVVIKLTSSATKGDYPTKIIDQVYRITNYDHIMVYKFDDDYCGQVIAEKKSDHLPSYLGMKFPASDIPKQARELYLKEKVRIIYDTIGDQKVILSSQESGIDEDLDLSHVAMRGVSPIHMEYLKNMGVEASFSVAILREERIWGLIACHNKSPRFVNYKTRSWLKFLSSLISLNIERLHKDQEHLGSVEKKLGKSQIMERVLATKDLLTGLLENKSTVLELVPSNGVIIKSGTDIRGIGDLPSQDSIEKLLEWVCQNNNEDFDVTTYKKSKDVLPKDVYHSHFAGLMVLQLSSLSQDYIVWTRKEKSVNVIWAGDPTRTKKYDPVKGRLTPRKSFERWQETVSDTADAWKEVEKQSAIALKNELRANLYKKYNEILQLNKELKDAYAQMESFSYSVSHDLKAPLRSIEGFSQILKEDYAEKLDEHGIHLLSIITESIARMNSFIKEILKYSKLNRDSLDVFKVDINEMIRKEWEICTAHEQRGIKLLFDDGIPNIYGDLNMINQVVTNLMTNSLKYVEKGVDPEIRIWHKEEEGFIRIYLEDNGIGIPKDQRLKVFDVFRRLVRREDYEGTGVGLSIVKKVIERHGGEIIIMDPQHRTKGTLFCFTLPSNPDFVNLIKNRSK